MLSQVSPDLVGTEIHCSRRTKCTQPTKDCLDKQCCLFVNITLKTLATGLQHQPMSLFQAITRAWLKPQNIIVVSLHDI